MNNPLNERIGVLKNTYEVIKLADFGSYIKRTALLLDIKLEITIEKGWVFEKGAFRAEAPESRIMAFKKSLDEAVAEYNK